MNEADTQDVIILQIRTKYLPFLEGLEPKNQMKYRVRILYRMSGETHLAIGFTNDAGEFVRSWLKNRREVGHPPEGRKEYIPFEPPNTDPGFPF